MSYVVLDVADRAAWLGLPDRDWRFLDLARSCK